MSKSQTAAPHRRGVVSTSIAIICLGAVIAPVAVYLFGVLLIGPYEGEGRALGFLGSVYGDALAGSPAAWALLLSPAAMILTWWAVARALRATRKP